MFSERKKMLDNKPFNAKSENGGKGYLFDVLFQNCELK